jgi:hypothetical protein
MAPAVEAGQLQLTEENSNGNSIDRSTCFVCVRRWRLGIFALAQELVGRGNQLGFKEQQNEVKH